ncbi:MAG TPA: hypothetical protein VNT22_08535 [Baekduia sp.]|nr:hypothetical protein [Baekduia sp.]
MAQISESPSGAGEGGISEKAGELGHKAQEQMQAAGGQLHGMIQTQVDQRSTQLGHRLTANADDLQSVAVTLRDQGKEGPAKMAEKAKDQVEKVGTWLEQADGDQIVRDVEDFARRNPWAMAAAAAAVGFAASRTLKASSATRQQGAPALQQGAGYVA